MAPTSPASRPRSTASTRSQRDASLDETTPLLVNRDDDESIAEELEDGGSKKSGIWQRWPSVLALAVLCLIAIIIMVAAFFVPQTVKEYAAEALVFEPTNLSIDSFTSSGVLAKIQGDFTLDASRVKSKASRNLGRFVTSIAKKVESDASQVVVTLPEYGNLLLGKADVPGIKIDIRNGRTTHLDFMSELKPGSKEGIGCLADEWLAGRMKHLRFKGEASVKVKSGIFSLGTHSISHFQEMSDKDIPVMPKFNIGRSVFHEVQESHQTSLKAEATLQVDNDYPVDLVMPPLNFDIFVDGCSSNEPYIKLADAQTPSVHLEPKKDLNLKVAGFIRNLPGAVLRVCSKSQRSPLDSILSGYIQGDDTTVYVRGSSTPSKETPKWMADLMSQLTIPLPFPGHAFGHLVKDFQLQNVHFELPDPSGGSNTTNITPKVSADVRALVMVPEEMNFPLEVRQFKAAADVFYHGKKLGYLDLDEWRSAKSNPIKNTTTAHEDLEVISRMNKVPLTITDNDVFVEVVQGLIHDKDTLRLTVKADVDVALKTSLGEFVVRGIPTEGKVPIKPLGADVNYSTFNPRVDDLKIVHSTAQSLTLLAAINFTNPTPYSATVPFADVTISVNGTQVGHATVESVCIAPGFNERVAITAVWNPEDASGRKGAAIGRELLSQYISGYNTTITLRTHAGTFPTHPSLGDALRVISVEMPTPKLKPTPRPHDPDGDDDDQPSDEDDIDGPPHFIDGATMHLFTSRATFTLLSPLVHNTLYITSLNATAFYHDDPVGNILYLPPSDPIEVAPGVTETPKLPVGWNLGSVGYEAVRRALGGTLKLDAAATVGVRVGEYEVECWFVGGGIGARVRI